MMQSRLSQQIIYNYFFRLLIISFSFLSVPITIKYMGKNEYGNWVVILSFMTWLSITDFGMSNGLRNFVTKNYSNKDELINGVRYCFIRLLKIGLVLSIFSIIGIFLFSPEIYFWPLIISIPFSFLFLPLTIYSALLYGAHNSSSVIFCQLISSIFWFLGVLLLSFFDAENAIVKISIVYCFGIFLAQILGWAIVYKKIKVCVFDLMKPRGGRHEILIKVGISFFIIQVSTLVIMNTDYILVSSFFSSEYVTEFFAYEKIYSVYNIALTIMLTPIWAVLSDYAINKNYDGIVNLIRKLLMVQLLGILLVLILSFFSGYLLETWIGIPIDIAKDKYINLIFALGAVVLAWNSVFSTIVNGIGTIRIQMYAYLIGALLNIPLTIIFIRFFDFGVGGVKLATLLSLSFTSIILPIQVYYNVKSIKEKNT